ncbi:MFS general substrate transporter [Rhizodiscina lignyota]|uniref:MFS general substrate transporter n=1 Tax=Rhizodiscina lignyota TaxID=1504668 RepID=A0A9P4IP57_9PEZI|nr:MFS general substrate transporter [Rhizodiscina lignyota]
MTSSIEKDVQVDSVPNRSEDEGQVEYFVDPEEEKKVVRKIDLYVMPALVIVFFFQFLDKQTINYAAVFGMQTDLHLSGSGFSWAITLYYFGQLASQYPSAYFISRFKVVRIVGITIAAWGACEMLIASTQNFGGLGTVRFFLGWFEGAASPGFVIITSNWYRRREHPARVAWWESCSGLSQIIGAVLMYLIGQANHLAIASWRVMYLVCGGATMLIGVCFAIFMPTDTTTAWFLKPDERRIATERLALDRSTRDRSSFNLEQVKEALMDPQTFLLFLEGLFICIPSAILKFSSLVISGFGFNKFQTMLVGLPAGAIQIITIWVAALGMQYTRDLRCFWGMVLSLAPLAGSICLLTLPASDKWGIVVATWFAACSSSLMVVSLSLAASNVKGNTKKSTVSAIFFVAYCTGCIISPQLWQAPDAPRYVKGCISSIVSWALLIITYAAHYLVLWRENVRRDRLQLENQLRENAEGVDIPEKEAHVGVSIDSDMTDRQDMKFRYTL